MSKEKFSIADNGFWQGDVQSNHYYDTLLANNILFVLQEQKIKSILDLGCGTGVYSKLFIDNNIDCDCCDGHPETNSLTNGICFTKDLSTPINFGRTYDCVMSLEVGEHIPESLENYFIENIVNHSHNLIIISWAIPGQPGNGHVNCKSNKYIIDKIQKYNFIFNQKTSEYLRQNSSLYWFKNTIMVFQK